MKDSRIDEMIVNAIERLLERNSKREDIVIAFSQLVKKYLDRHMTEMFMSDIKIGDRSKYMDVQMYSNHPYNEIVVYDKERCSYDPYSIIKIEFIEDLLKEGEMKNNRFLGKYITINKDKI